MWNFILHIKHALGISLTCTCLCTSTHTHGVHDTHPEAVSPRGLKSPYAVVKSMVSVVHLAPANCSLLSCCCGLEWWIFLSVCTCFFSVKWGGGLLGPWALSSWNEESMAPWMVSDRHKLLKVLLDFDNFITFCVFVSQTDRLHRDKNIYSVILRTRNPWLRLWYNLRPKNLKKKPIVSGEQPPQIKHCSIRTK